MYLAFYVVDFKNTWRGLANSTEQYVLRYESKHLKRVGSSMGYFVELAAKAAAKQVLKYTALASKNCCVFVENSAVS